MLYKRLLVQGTLEEPNGVSDPQFALPGTINWMRALSLLVGERNLGFPAALQVYSQEQQRQSTAQEENTVFEQLSAGPR